MGWLFTPGSTLKGQIAELTRETDRYRCLKKCLRLANPGNARLWAVFETKEATPRRFVMEFLLMYLGRHDGWGYKDVGEDMGPCEVDCPISYLDLLTEPENDYSREWRVKVRAAAAAGVA